MSKSDVYSWRLAPELKRSLEQTARREGISLAGLLERIVADWLKRRGPGPEEELQDALHQAAADCLGAVHGGEPDRATSARQRIRARLSHRREA